MIHKYIACRIIIIITIIPLFWVLNGAVWGVKSINFNDQDGVINFTLYATFHDPHGVVHKFSGSVGWDEQKGISSATGILVIPVSSLDTKNKSRDRNMYEFCMDTAHYPYITFILDSVGNMPPSYGLNSLYTVDLLGKLTIKDVTKHVTLPVHFIFTKKYISVQGSYLLNWKDYHVKDPSNFFLKLNQNMKLDWEISVPAD